MTNVLKENVYMKSFDSFVSPGQKDTPPGWLAELRTQAYERFKQIGFPTKKLDVWKHTPLEWILGVPFVSGDGGMPEKSDVSFLKNLFSLTPEHENRIVFINGVYSARYSSARSLPQGVVLGRLAESMGRWPDKVRSYLAPRLSIETNAFSLVNTFSFKDGVFVYMPHDTAVKRPLDLFFVTLPTDGELRVFYPRILIVLEDRATAEIAVNFTGDAPARYFNNAHAEIHLGQGAVLHYSCVQRESKQAFSLLSNHFTLKKESVLDALSFNLSGRLVRNTHEVEFTGEHASASHKGLSVLSGESQAFHYALVEHAAPRCVSRQYYKNVLADKSQSEFNSLVHVHSGAERSDSNQLNKNLLLSDAARCYSRPQLKIDADDVVCTHGAATGQFNQEELFYLRSRGFSEKEARSMLTVGFAEEILEAVEPALLKKQFKFLVNEALKRVIGS